jgi:hypothetical protein
MKQAIIIPIYIGHRSRFNSLLTNLKSTSLVDCSLIFIATNLKEKLYFSLIAHLKNKPITILNLEKLAKQSVKVGSRELNKRLKVTAGIINLKKLLGLNACFSMGYEHAIVVDSDIFFFEDFNADALFKSCQKNYQMKVFYGVKHSDSWLTQITESSLRYLNLDFNSIQNNVYSWFFDVPYYDSVEFNNFLTYLNQLYGEEWWSHLNSLTFDHLLFQFFLVSQRGWRFDDYSDISTSIPELLSPADLLSVNKSRGYWPLWISYKCISAMPDLKSFNPSLQIIYHIDR